jgi:hypothetical protein
MQWNEIQYYTMQKCNKIIQLRLWQLITIQCNTEIQYHTIQFSNRVQQCNTRMQSYGPTQNIIKYYASIHYKINKNMLGAYNTMLPTYSIEYNNTIHQYNKTVQYNNTLHMTAIARRIREFYKWWTFLVQCNWAFVQSFGITGSW